MKDVGAFKLYSLSVPRKTDILTLHQVKTMIIGNELTEQQNFSPCC